MQLGSSPRRWMGLYSNIWQRKWRGFSDWPFSLCNQSYLVLWRDICLLSSNTRWIWSQPISFFFLNYFLFLSFLIFTLHPSIVLIKPIKQTHSGIIFATYILVYMHRRSEIPGFNTPWNSWNSTINGTIEYLEWKGERTWREWNQVSETMWGCAPTTIG